MTADPAATLQALADWLCAQAEHPWNAGMRGWLLALAEHVDAVRYDEQLQDQEYPPLVVRTLLAVAAVAGVTECAEGKSSS